MAKQLKKSGELPKGFVCACDKFNKFPPWLYAHWDVEVEFTCECGRVYRIWMGEAEEDDCRN